MANNELEVTEKQLDDIAASLGTPDFAGLMGDDDSDNDITQQVLAERPANTTGAGDILSLMIVFGTNFVAKRKGEHWKIDADEARELSTAVDAAFPDLALSPKWALVGVTIGIFGPRIMVDIQNEQRLIEQEEKARAENEAKSAPQSSN